MSRPRGERLRRGKATKARIDAVLAERGLFPSRSAAAGPCGRARFGSARGRAVALRPSQLVEPEADFRRRRRARASSPGAASSSRTRSMRSPIDVAGRDCLDVGASTGGFTDCLLQRGAAQVMALDVAYGQIDLRLREDPRVTVLERLNARDLRRTTSLSRRSWPRSTSPSSR